MKLILGLLVALAPLAAQDQAPQTAAPAKEQAPAAQTPAPAEANPPEAEKPVTGTIDAGYRWVTGPGGNFNTYRSVVNLGEGPKILNFDLTIDDPSKHFWDNLTVMGSNWGDDPYSALKVIAEKQRLYRLNASYRNIAYFDFLPSFADPRTATGVLLNERSFDSRSRVTDINLELFPSRKVVPYFAYGRSSSFGSGITPFVTGSTNEYPVRNLLDSHQDNYRGGVRIELARNHFMVEQGRTSFTDNQQVLSTGPNPGDRTTPYLGQPLSLLNALETYDVTGGGNYTRALWNSNMIPWVNISADFLYAKPNTDVRYAQSATGNFVLLGLSRFYSSSSLIGTGQTSMPHTASNVGLEFHPGQRIRVYYTSSTDSYHNDSNLLLAEQLAFVTGGVQAIQTPVKPYFELNYYQQRVDVDYDIDKHFTLRGGFRYEWGDGTAPGPQSTGTGPDKQSLDRKVYLAGATYRAGQKFSVTGQFEASDGVNTYFRTSLQDYKRVRTLARYQITPSLLLTAGFNLLRNENPANTINYYFQSTQETASLLWTPKSGGRVSVLGEYTHSRLRSDIDYYNPSFLTLQPSNYRDFAHTGTAAVNLVPFKWPVAAPTITFGGSFFKSSGSRPTDFYQPLGRVLFPVHNHFDLYSEWRWYGLTQPFYLYEGFRTHEFVTGVRIKL